MADEKKTPAESTGEPNKKSAPALDSDHEMSAKNREDEVAKTQLGEGAGSKDAGSFSTATGGQVLENTVTSAALSTEDGTAEQRVSFNATVSKEIEDEDGNKWIVYTDNLEPGEKLRVGPEDSAINPTKTKRDRAENKDEVKDEELSPVAKNESAETK